MAKSDPGGQVVPLRRIEDRKAALSEISDEALLAACGVGDAAALGALYDRHHAAVFRLVSRLLRCERSEVDDLVQTTFMAAWRSAKGFRGGGSVKSFLYGIAANTVRQHVRSARRRRDAYAALETPANAATPAAEAIRKQELDRLALALDGLPHDLRAAYVLCELEDLPGADAAKALDCRIGTLWRRLHDARKALRDAIEGGQR